MNFIGDIEPIFWKSKEKELKNKILNLKREIGVLNLKLENKNEVVDHNLHYITDSGFSDTNTHLLRSIFLENPSAIIISNFNGEIKLCSNSTLKLFEYSAEEFMKKSIDDLVPISNAQHARLRQNYNRNPESRGMGLGRDLHAKKKDGTTFPVEIGLNSIEINNTKYVISTIVDLTNRNKLKELLDVTNKELVKEIKQYKTSLHNTKTFFATLKKNSFDSLHSTIGELPSCFKHDENKVIDLKLLIAPEAIKERSEIIKINSKVGGYYSYKYDTITKESISIIEQGFFLGEDASDVFTLCLTIVPR